MTREQALEILHTNMESPNLRKHCYAVAAVMAALADRTCSVTEEIDKWYISGLLHDADYEQTKENTKEHTKLVLQWIDAHPSTGSGSSTSSREIKNAILAHGWGYVESNPEPMTPMEWSLYCCDELTGLIIAVTLIRPTKKISNVTVDNVLAKWNEKSFAAGVHREQIDLCEEKLGIKREEFVTIALAAMQGIAEELGL